MKTYFSDSAEQPQSHIGAALESLAATIHNRASAGNESYTYRLLTGNSDKLLKKIVEEACEVTLAAKDVEAPDACPEDIDHLRYEAADVVYHLMVLLERAGIPLDEFAAELNSRMTTEEIQKRGGVIMLKPEYINRAHEE